MVCSGEKKSSLNYPNSERPLLGRCAGSSETAREVAGIRLCYSPTNSGTAGKALGLCPSRVKGGSQCVVPRRPELSDSRLLSPEA